ncbi:MAG: DNA translocase FtsK [Gammaproteobacteria bacterium]|nr:MAG: DNA translocase FtsK [Gammaproteobacteria bacterium]
MTERTDRNEELTDRYIEQRLREGGLILVLAAALFLVLALFSYNPSDPGWTHIGERGPIENWGGRVGAWIADVLMYFLGYTAWFIPALMVVQSLRVVRGQQAGRHPARWLLRLAGGILVLLGSTALLATYSVLGLGPESGGLLGDALATAGLRTLNLVGATLVWSALFLTGITLATDVSWLRLMDRLGQWTLRLGQGAVALLARFRRSGTTGEQKEAPTSESVQSRPVIHDRTVTPGRIARMKARWHDWLETRRARKAARSAEKAEQEALRAAKRAEPVIESHDQVPVLAEPVTAGDDSDSAIPVVTELAETQVVPEDKGGAHPSIRIMPFQRKSTQEGKRIRKEQQKSLFGSDKGPLPPITLLDEPDKRSNGGFSKEALEHMSRLLEEKLADFGVKVTVVEVNPGPVITRFEIQPAAGVKVSRISNLAKDLARSLAVIAVRVVEVIPGKSVVGIEIPNENRDIVRLREVLASAAYDQSDSPLTLALGNDIAGDPVVANLAKMPHLLVAGTTGSGKSVGVNAMLLSMLFKATPEELRLIMIDPKMLELSIYDGIPHLLAPVVTDMKEAANALRWCVGEMERRYKLMASMGVRNLAGFNKKVEEAMRKGQPLKDPLWQPDATAIETEQPDLLPLPYIVVVIDEFADMMMIVGKKVEELIARIAQKARAAGIHLILATQRPSVDVITGLIKANIPTRIAFQVSSKIDSRTILDQGGAEQLLGHGDMLYMPPGTSLPVRVHGAFVADDEVHRVVEEWKSRGEPEYLEEILEGTHESDFVASFDKEGGENGTESDPLFDQAVAFVTETRRASISAVQRRLKIGYNRAANLVEAMEAAGIVSPAGHNGAREVLAPPPPK